MNKLLFSILISGLIFSCGGANSSTENTDKISSEVVKSSSSQENPEGEDTSDTDITESNDAQAEKEMDELSKGGNKIFKGAWFDIEYPADFTAEPSIKDGNGIISAFFTSPDKEVKFYIFSPQWSGDATDISLDSKKEKLASDKTQPGKNKTVRFYTIVAKDNSYTRSYQETTESEGSVKWIIGIEYKDQKAYDRYKPQYLTFKKSLQQFAD